MENFGIWTIVPAIAVIVIALCSRKTIESLLIGFASAYVIISVFTGRPFFDVLSEAFYKTASDSDNIWVIAVVLLFGTFSSLLNSSGGTRAVSAFINSRCKGERSTGFFTWILSILIFLDDYLNILTVSSCMKDTYDRKKMPRHSLAYIMDSAGVCACVLIPFSSWAVFYSTLFFSQKEVAELGLGSAMDTYYHILPYMFYSMFSLLIVLLFVLKVIKPVGPMKKAYEKAAGQDIFPENGSGTGKGRLIYFVLPVLILIVTTVVLDDMLISLIITVIFCFLLYVSGKAMTAGEFCELWVRGMQDMLPTALVLFSAFLMKQACMDIGLPSYAVEKTLPYLSGPVFPAAAFILVSLLSFMAGNGWSGPALCIPVIIPMAAACKADMLLTMAAVVSGGVFCGHICFYSDVAVLAAASCEIEPMEHVKTQLPYALTAFLLSLILYAVMGMT